MSDWENFTIGQLMNNVHLVAKEHDDAPTRDDLTEKERAARDKNLMLALAEVTGKSPIEVSEALGDYFDQMELTDEDVAQLDEEGIPEDERVGTPVEGKAEIDTEKLADAIRGKLFDGDSK